MTDYLELFKASYNRVCGGDRWEDFLARFYAAFMGRSDEVRARFIGTEMRKQREVLHRSLQLMLQFYLEPVATPELEQLAARHTPDDLDVPPALYDAWFEALITTLRTSDPEHSLDVELAWRIVFGPGIAFMKLRYLQSTARRAVDPL